MEQDEDMNEHQGHQVLSVMIQTPIDDKTPDVCRRENMRQFLVREGVKVLPHATGPGEVECRCVADAMPVKQGAVK